MPEALNDYSINAKIVCPFFKGQKRIDLKCEGIFEGQCSTVLRFKDGDAKFEHIKNFCVGSKCYLGCPIAQFIMEKYEIEKQKGE